MGYTTEFQGVLTFTNDLTIQQLKTLKTILEKDSRDEIPEDAKIFIHYEPATRSVHKSPSFYYIDLVITDNYEGLKWSGAEKSYGMEYQVQFVIDYMRSKYPDFGLSGYMSAQGEDVDDRWRLEIQDGKAVKILTPPKGKKVECPHCGESFYIEDCK